MNSTSPTSSQIGDIEIGISKYGLTRKVLRAEVVKNNKAPHNTVKIAIVHQRRGKKEDEWEDLGGPQLSQLHAGEAAKIQLDTKQTKELHEHLSALYRIGEDGIRRGTTVLEIHDEDEVISTDVGRARVIEKLLKGDYSEEIWQALVDENPTLATKMSLARIYEERKQVLSAFEHDIDRDLPEKHWQKFLEQNRWIFGSSYIGRIGETRINIKSTLDHPLITEDGHLEIVEIKKPTFPFWRKNKDGSNFQYRDKYLVPHSELVCALSQGTNYILEVEREMDKRTWADTHDGIYPIKPKCLVVHGRSSGWGDLESTAYRVFNDSLHGITVITFDHLLLRARQIIELFKPG
ncbi:MAG: DUF4263 domain-containing protein [candidate division Zixibacteria bacterium]|nr:DUF4263 domain-containing protein [candidate division Zixibacteria bacterium]